MEHFVWCPKCETYTTSTRIALRVCRCKYVGIDDSKEEGFRLIGNFNDPDVHVLRRKENGEEEKLTPGQGFF